MKRNIIIFCCLYGTFFSSNLSAQFTYKIKADSVKITNDSCNAELIVENSTKNISGYLFNYGNGRTRFQSLDGLYQPLENQRLSTGNSPSFTNELLTGGLLHFVNGANDIILDGSDPGTPRSHYIKFRSQTTDKGVGLQTLPGGVGNNVPYEFDFCTVPDGSGAFMFLGDGPRQVHTIASLGISGSAWPIVFEVNPGMDPTDHQYDVIRLQANRTIQFPQLGAGYLVTDASGTVSAAPSNSWSLNGNAGADTSVNFIGTTDNWPLIFKVNSQTVGKIVPYTSTDGGGWVALGSQALAMAGNNLAGNYSVAIGEQALYANTSGFSNTATGRQALYSNTTGSINVANGPVSLYSNTTGSENTAVGFGSLLSTTTGNSNTAIGRSALIYNTTGSYNTALGVYASPVSGNLTNTTTIGYNASIGVSNAVMIGNSSVTIIGGYANWSNFSDGRFKKNIKEDVPGLDFITQLRPVTYTLDIKGINHFHGLDSMKQKMKFEKIANSKKNVSTTADSLQQAQEAEADKIEAQAISEKEAIVHTGFIAQEVEKVADKLHYNFSGLHKPQNNKDNYTLAYGDFVVPLVKAVQEQQKLIQEQQQQMKTQQDALQSQQKVIEQLQKRIEKLEKNSL